MSLPVLQGERITLRPITEADLAALVAIIQSPGVREWWWDSGDAEQLRGNLPNDGNAFVIEIDGELAGWLGFEEELDPGYRHASVDLSLDLGETAPQFEAMAEQKLGVLCLR